MRRLIRFIQLALCASLCFMISSCFNPTENSSYDENQIFIFKGKIELTDSVLNINKHNSILNNSRSAQPDLPDPDTLTYYAKAINKNDSTDVILSDDLNPATKTFSIPLRTGVTWIIEVGATGTSAFGTNAELIKKQIEFTPSESTPKKEEKFYLAPFITDNGIGKLNLTIGIENPTGNKIKKVVIEPKENKWKAAAKTLGWSDLSHWNSTSSSLVFSSKTEDSSTVHYQANLSSIELSSDNFNSGIWEVQLNFLDNDDQLLFSSTQIICIYNNLKTDKWENSKTSINSTDLINSSGNFYLTTRLIDAYGLTDFYVGGEDADDDNGNGSPKTPFATILKAIRVVNGIARTDKTYTIHIQNGITQTAADTIVITSNISIECYLSSYGDRQGTARLCSQSTTETIQVGDGTKSAILTIDGVKNDTNNWSGLSIESSRPSRGENTRAVRVLGLGSFYMNGGKISGHTLTQDDPSANGAGVLIDENGFFSMTGGIITTNRAGKSGGAVYISSNGEFQMKGGIITNNKARSSGFGGAIYNAGTLTLGGNVYIYGNSIESTDTISNIYLPTNKMIKVSGNLSGSTIGITTEQLPQIGNNLQITNGYAYQKSINNDAPHTIFKSDNTDFAILADSRPVDDDSYTGEVFLGKSGGTITPYTTPTINVNFLAPQATTPLVYPITITCSETAPDWTGSDSTNTTVTLKCNDVNVPASLWAYSYDNNTLTLQSTLPAGTYVIHVDVQYKGYKYSATQRITKS